MDNNEQKRFIKWLIILIVEIVITIVTAILVSVYCDYAEQSEVTEVIPMPKTITFTSAQARAGGTTSVKVKANVEPYNAENTQVDFTAKWKNAPITYTKTVSDYVTVRQESDGSQTATITCIRPFTEYNVAITVTTRDGGYTAECLCTFSGKATSIELSVDGKELKSDNNRGTYYLLDSKKASTVRIHATNAYDYVTSPRYTVTVNVPDVSLWFGDCDYGEYGETYFSKVWLEKLRDRYNAGKLFAVGSVNNNSFTITTKKSLEYEAQTVETTYDEYGFVSRHGKDACVYDPYDLGLGSINNVEDIRGKNAYNVGIIDKLCYEITVTEQTSGISETLRFWVSI